MKTKNDYLIDCRDAWKRFFAHRDIEQSDSPIKVTEITYEFMSIATGKSESDLKGWFPLDFLNANNDKDLLWLLRNFIYIRGYQAGLAAGRAEKRIRLNDACTGQ